MLFHAAFHGSIIHNAPAYRPRSETMPGYHRFSTVSYDAFVAFSALEAIAAKTRQSAPNEMIGYLVGRPFRDAKGFYAVVTEAIIAESAHCGRVTVETTLDDEQRLLSTLLIHHPLAERLGWFHSHPFWKPEYSPTDRENQRFWSEPYQLGLLACLDTEKNVTIFAFRGPESEEAHPPYAASSSPPARVPAFRPARGIEHRESAPQPARPARRKRRRRPGLLLLTLAVGVVWPLAYLTGVWMIVRAMREGRESTTWPAVVGEDGKGPSVHVPDRDPVQESKPAAPQTTAPATPAEQPNTEGQPQGMGGR